MKRILLIICILVFTPVLVLAWGEEENVGNITGKLILNDGQPMSGATVFLFDAAVGPAPVLGKFWRVPDVIAETDENGGFNIQVKTGKYYLGAIKRISAMHPFGPPSSGDFVYPSHATELKGKQKLYRVVKWETIDVGTINNIVPFDREKHSYKGLVTAIEGTVYLDDGKPAFDAIVFAYDKPEMSGNPLYVSEPTDLNGKYILRIGKPGLYYLRVRGGYGGGMPATGTIMGGGSPSGVKVVADKTIKGIDIIGSAFVNFGNRSRVDDSSVGQSSEKGQNIGLKGNATGLPRAAQ